MSRGTTQTVLKKTVMQPFNITKINEKINKVAPKKNQSFNQGF